jgi:hypothetical protein
VEVKIIHFLKIPLSCTHEHLRLLNKFKIKKNKTTIIITCDALLKNKNSEKEQSGKENIVIEYLRFPSDGNNQFNFCVKLFKKYSSFTLMITLLNSSKFSIDNRSKKYIIKATKNKNSNNRFEDFIKKKIVIKKTNKKN